MALLQSNADDVFFGDSELAGLMRAKDWSATPVGPVDRWPRSLRTIVALCLSSRYPMSFFWGPELVQFYNDAYRPVLGASKHPSALGQVGSITWREIWETMLGPMFGDVIRKGASIYGDDTLFLLDRNGYVEETYFNFSYDPLRDDEGRVGGVLVLCQETTDRVLGERRLQTLRGVAESANVAKTIDDVCDLVAAALGKNPADVPFALLYLVDERRVARLRAATGLDAEMRSSLDAIDLAGTHPWARALASAVSERALRQIELPPGFGPSSLPGLPRPEHALALPITRTGEDAAVGVLVVGKNPRRALDTVYKDFLDLLAKSVSAALATARAYQETKERADALAELDRAKTAFFGDVSHELRTPLTLLVGPLEEVLARDRIPPEDRERLVLADRSARRLRKLVDTLLEFSRIEAGRVEPAFEPTDLAEFTRDLASVFRSAIERAGLALALELPALAEPAFVDREMWEKIVLNLLSNALKFTRAGQIAVHLAEQGDRVELSVRDTGVGIPASELGRVFERFHRVRHPDARTVEGSGIGLALVSELVKLHGGE
ncbi:MAG TPA: GAF domain-containing sensor histidine kinase, partial [Minicystis sp.]|nr:GAF domain-containing sensor histidine kinase [Minicystis sp.]